MTLTELQLDHIDDYASCFLTISQIAVLLEVDPDLLREEIADIRSEISKRYHKAKLRQILELRRQEIELAKLGSNVAIDLVNKYISNQYLDE